MLIVIGLCVMVMTICFSCAKDFESKVPLAFGVGLCLLIIGIALAL